MLSFLYYLIADLVVSSRYRNGSDKRPSTHSSCRSRAISRPEGERSIELSPRGFVTTIAKSRDGVATVTSCGRRIYQLRRPAPCKGAWASCRSDTARNTVAVGNSGTSWCGRTWLGMNYRSHGHRRQKSGNPQEGALAKVFVVHRETPNFLDLVKSKGEISPNLGVDYTEPVVL